MGSRAWLLLILGAAAGLLVERAVQRAPSSDDELDAARRRAYVGWLEGEQAAPGEAPSASARRQLVVYGDDDVVESVADYWRDHFEWPVCCGGWEELQAEGAVYRAMRSDLLGAGESVAAEDLFLLLYECRLPASADEVEPCPEGVELADRAGSEADPGS